MPWTPGASSVSSSMTTLKSTFKGEPPIQLLFEAELTVRRFGMEQCRGCRWCLLPSGRRECCHRRTRKDRNRLPWLPIRAFGARQGRTYRSGPGWSRRATTGQLGSSYSVSYSGLEESSAGELGGNLLVKSISGFDGNLVFSRDLKITGLISDNRFEAICELLRNKNTHSLEATTTVSDSQSLDCLSSQHF